MTHSERRCCCIVPSLPTRGGWIEIRKPLAHKGFKAPSLPTRGGWIEMGRRTPGVPGVAGPSPHGEGGLKSLWDHRYPAGKASLPTRGGWIEMRHVWPRVGQRGTSLPTRGGWIETEMLSTRNTYKIVILNEYTCSVYINSQAISSGNAMIPSVELKLRRGLYRL